jgi:SpoVK/Ycf46/Vps4 family AAA+-type ATPase
LTDGYSGADLTNLAREASMGPVRDFMREKKGRTDVDPVMRPIQRHDFNVAMRSVRASVSNSDLDFYISWNEQFGTQQYVGEGDQQPQDADAGL